MNIGLDWIGGSNMANKQSRCM